MRDAPAAAKDRAVSAPMPLPPPVMITVLPLAESSGRLGEMDSYEVECHLVVGAGNGGIVIGSWLEIILAISGEDIENIDVRMWSQNSRKDV